LFDTVDLKKKSCGMRANQSWTSFVITIPYRRTERNNCSCLVLTITYIITAGANSPVHVARIIYAEVVLNEKKNKSLVMLSVAIICSIMLYLPKCLILAIPAIGHFDCSSDIDTDKKHK
jgi:hypothetical protein